MTYPPQPEPDSTRGFPVPPPHDPTFAPPVVSGAPYQQGQPYPPQPGLPYPPHGAAHPTPPPQRKSNAVKVTLIICGSVVAVCLILGLIGTLAGNPDPKTVAAQPAATSPTAPTATKTTPPSKATSPAPLSPVDKPAQVKMPDVRGQNAAVAQDYLTKLGFTNIQLGSQDEFDTWVVLPENWTVKKQSTKAGTKIPTDTLIVLTCTKVG